MTKRSKIGAVGALCAALALGVGGVAYAVSGDGEESVAGTDADRAAEAALGATGGGEVLEVETADSGYEVEVRQPDGAVIEVAVDPGFSAIATAAGDDDQGESGDDDNAGED